MSKKTKNNKVDNNEVATATEQLPVTQTETAVVEEVGTASDVEQTETTTETPPVEEVVPETSVFALSKDHLRAFRMADTICFDHCPEGKEQDRIPSGIRAIKKGKAPFYQEATVQAPAKSSVYLKSDSTVGETYQDGKKASCGYVILCSNDNDQWQTICKLLRPGNEIELRWIADGHANQYVRQASVVDPGNGSVQLHADALWLYIRKNETREYSFLLHVSVCPNNSARMIRPAG